MAMEARHKFRSGETVDFVLRLPFYKGPYRIVSPIASDDAKLFYRIRDETEPFDRVVEESELAPLGVIARPRLADMVKKGPICRRKASPK